MVQAIRSSGGFSVKVNVEESYINPVSLSGEIYTGAKSQSEITRPFRRYFMGSERMKNVGQILIGRFVSRL